jgi:type I restriction-modification system DNA methylase subunit
MANDIDRIRAIKSFPSLIKYLRDDLGWEFETDDVEDLTFDYEPEELGLDAKTAVKIKDIKQLRPLVTNQPWGIFYINFEPKRLPVVVLRRVLRSLVLKRRASANRGQQAAWKLNDLLFISSYGENDERAITFAHFSDNSEVGDLPTLKVLGWDAQDTILHLEDAHRTLKEKLRFPDDPSDVEAWRAQWASAFTLRHREVVTTSIELAKRLAELATLIRDRANRVLAIESDKGAFRRLHEAFKEALIHDLSADDFADMYAQTIAYGLLSARVSRPAGLVADNLVDMVPSTNPFLKELLGTFLKIGGRDTSKANQKANAIDFDELGINEVVELLRRANMEAVLRDFGNRNPTEDPVIHFYELFLKEYDPVKRMKRGVFYTPRPVVSFIVRSIHEILRNEFGLADGLADTTTWGEFVKLQKTRAPKSETRIPEGVSPDAPFVQILDPATGTGTFLVETIDVIYSTLAEKWRSERKSNREIRELWNDYVPKHLLPRLHGFELMMAPYSIAHMKIGLKLRETGYSFLSSERARIYLTNTLEEPKDFSGYFAQMAPALAHEAAEANTIKRHTPITAVIGNPPYSKNSGNRGEHAESLVQPYKDAVLGERNVQPLSDDYVKFIAWSNLAIGNRFAVIGMITNRSYLEGVIHRGMRNSLLSSYDKLFVIDLHGDSNVGEAAPDGSFNENVFDITQGVAISILCRSQRTSSYSLRLVDSWGRRNDKYEFLLKHNLANITWNSLTPTAPYYFFVPKDFSLNEEINTSWKVDQIFPNSGMGLKTRRDHFLLSIDENDLTSRFKSLIDAGDVESLRKSFAVSDNPQWTLAKMQKLVRREGVKNGIYSIAYRPFDRRFIWYHREAIERGDARYPIMQHVLKGGLSLLVSRLSMNEDFDSVFVVNGLSEMKTAESTRGSHCFPLYIRGDQRQMLESSNRSKGRANLAPQFIADFAARLNLRFLPDGRGDLSETFAPEDVFHYIYAVFHSPTYRTRYSEFLKIDFPRVPLTTDRTLFSKLCQLGANLVALHLLEDEYAAASWNEGDGGKLKDEEIQIASANPLASDVVRFHDAGSKQVAKGFPKYDGGKVYINPTSYFGGVTEAVWNFHVGGYQVAHKWLKDRRERTLSPADITHYTRTCHALASTVEHMRLIDEVIEEHGGFPLVGSQDAAPKTRETADTLPFG